MPNFITCLKLYPSNNHRIYKDYHRHKVTGSRDFGIIAGRSMQHLTATSILYRTPGLKWSEGVHLFPLYTCWAWLFCCACGWTKQSYWALTKTKPNLGWIEKFWELIYKTHKYFRTPSLFKPLDARVYCWGKWPTLCYTALTRPN